MIVVLGGCLPYPHRYQHRPAVDGLITESAQPRAGVRVSLRWVGNRPREQSPCEIPAEIEALTDAAGRFTLAGERRIRLWIFALPAHSAEMWGLCFETPEGTRVPWTSPWRYRAGPRYGPRHFELDCDLARRPADVCWMRGGGEYGKFG
jgi:hypothetical protein